MTRARDNSCFVAFCNAVGGQDELIFDGHSCVLDDEGEVVARAPRLRGGAALRRRRAEAVIARRLRDVRRRALAREREATSARAGRPRRRRRAQRERQRASSRRSRRSSRSSSRCGSRSSSACATTCEKNGFDDVVVGVSGGIDSASTAALAAEALGPERVHCVSMPSRYSSEGTRADARRLAESLGCDFREISIEPMVEAFTGRARAEHSPAASRISPRRTSRRGSAARC